MFNQFIHILQQHPLVFMGLVALLSVLVGSFLNVVIYRLPQMLFREWKEQCEECLKITENSATHDNKTFNLLWPNSHCPHCKQALKFWHNIPILSFLLLLGRAACCQQKISWRYPCVEFICVILSCVVAWHFGFSWQTGAALIFTWSLLALTVIDLDHQLLPDNITLLILWLGLVCNLFGLFVPLQDAVIGAMIGYASLWSITWIFKCLTGKVGMGHGDFKLFAMLGAWLGWSVLPAIILISAILGSLVGLTLIICLGRDRQLPIPFGPYLALAGWCVLLWGQPITRFYSVYLM